MERNEPKTYREMAEEELRQAHIVTCAGVREYIQGAQRRGEEIARLLASRMSLEGKRALDVGTGDGGVAVALSRWKCFTVAFDNSWDNVVRARQLAREASVTPSFLVMDAEHAGLAPDRFDVVILADVLEHVADPDKVVSVLADSMKRGALCYVSVPNAFAPWNIIREQHYHLFGLSLMPQRLAKSYVTRVRKRSTIYAVRSKFSWRSLRKLFAAHGIALELCGEFRSISRLEHPEQLIDPVQRSIATFLSVLRLRPVVKALFRVKLYQRWFAPGLVCIGRKIE